MKRTKINLLTDRADYQKLEKIFRYVRFVSVSVAVILFIVIFVFFILLSGQNSKIESLLTQKKSLLTELENKNNVEARINLIQKKFENLKEYMKDDAHSLPYYNLLQSALKTSTEAAVLKSFQIDKTRDVTFVVSFVNFDQLLDFFKFIESDNFLKYFEKISLKSFSAIGDSNQSATKYELSFIGNFKKINE